MKKTIILLLILLTFNCFSQKKIAKNTLSNKAKSEISISIPREIHIKNVTNSIDNPLDKNMPWIAALIIGLLSAGVNFWIAHRLRQSNESSLQRQLESSKTITMTQFKATIATKNRQDWINELRHELADLLYAFTRASSSDITREEVTKYTEKVLFSKAKIQLMINSGKPEQKDLQDKIETLFNTYLEKEGKLENIEYASLRTDVILSARRLFDLHWKKVKNLE
jgi:AraC-like DNA-binding protein